MNEKGQNLPEISELPEIRANEIGTRGQYIFRTFPLMEWQVREFSSAFNLYPKKK